MSKLIETEGWSVWMDKGPIEKSTKPEIIIKNRTDFPIEIFAMNQGKQLCLFFYKKGDGKIENKKSNRKR